MTQENCLIVQSGGPTAVMNNSLIGLVDAILESFPRKTVYGAKGGINGLLNKEFIDLSKWTNSERNKLRWTPGSALGTCRHRLTDEEFHDINKALKDTSIKYLFYIGGNGSMAVADKISKIANEDNYSLQVIGIPTSIDNDVVCTDHSPGYGSAAKFIATSMMDMKIDVASYMDASRINIIETMGRHTGWLAAAASLANHPDDTTSETFIYLPEIPFNMKDCLQKVTETVNKGKSVFLVVAEGIRGENGQLLNQSELEFDGLDRAKLGGVSAYLSEQMKKYLDYESKVFMPSIWQRSSIRHAAKVDVDEAYQLGYVAWQFVEKGASGQMVSVKNEEFALVPLTEVAGKEKFIPTNWYDKDTHRMKKDFIQYVSPLIQGELDVPMKNGLPVYKGAV